MKQTVVITLPEIEGMVAAVIGQRPSHRGKFIGAIEFFVDPTNPDEALRIRANVTLLDTQAAARAFHESLMKPKEAVKA